MLIINGNSNFGNGANISAQPLENVPIIWKMMQVQKAL